MLKNYFKIALRNLLKQKGYASINILGLAIGLTCFILIGMFVRYELSYDTFHEKADRIYRIVKESGGEEFLGTNRFANTPAPLVEALEAEIPEVEHATQISKSTALLEHGAVRFYEDGIFARPHFFDVFSFELLQGNPARALDDPASIVVTQTLARKYFGNTDPLGRTVTVSYLGELFSGKQEMQVTGVVADPPANSHFNFDYIVPVRSAREYVEYIDRWDSNSFLTYAVLQAGHSVPAFEAKLNEMGRKYLMQEAYYQENPAEAGGYGVQPLTDIHLYSNLNAEFGPNGDIKYVYLFAAIALLILIIACINYINLATARASIRTMEVGVRKVMGAHRKQLIGQFLCEAVLPSLVALALAMGLSQLLMPAFNELTAREITFSLGENGLFLGVLLLIGLVVGLLAGTYPAFMMSTFNPVGMMKGMLRARAGKSRLRNVLVVMQFAISIALILGVIVVHRQLSYIQHAQTGVDREQVIVMEIKDQALYERYPALRQTLLGYPGVLEVTAGQGNPTDIGSASFIREWEGAQEGQGVMLYRSIIQHGYLDLFDIELVEGRDFEESRPVDAEEGLIINETAMRELGWTTAVGKTLNLRGRSRVIGVVKDFTFHSFHHAVAPLAFTLESGWWFPYQRIYIKAGEEGIQQTLSHIEQTMAEFSADFPFEYYFLDDAYNQLYQAEIRLGSLMGYFTMLALIVACLGLLGLAAFIARQRTKEIGVRKVLGASLGNILMMLSRDFLQLVLIAFVIAAPIGFLLINNWLQGFAYRISIGLGTFLLAGGVVFLLAWITVSYQSLRAALVNPVESLRQD